MADAAISALTSYTTPIATDVLPIVDTTNGITKKVTVATLNAFGAAVATGGTITAQTLQNIAGMTVALSAGTWVFEMMISGSAATGTAGAQFGVGFSGTETSIAACFEGQLSTTTWAATAVISAVSTASTIVMTTSAAQCSCYIFGQIVVTVAGNLTAMGLKVTSQTLTINASSWMRAYKVA